MNLLSSITTVFEAEGAEVSSAKATSAWAFELGSRMERYCLIRIMANSGVEISISLSVSMHTVMMITYEKVLLF